MTAALQTRIDAKFAELKEQREKGFIAYITAGDPSLKDTEDMVLRLEDAGVDVVELGVPFSDPLADGSVNHQSATRALEAGVTVDGVFDTVEQIRKRSDVPILLYVYLNLLIARGYKKTVRRIAQAGADAVLILDLPIEELDPYEDDLMDAGLNNVRLVTPTSPPERVKKIVQRASGFVYCVSRTGVTGMQNQLSEGAGTVVRRTKKHTKLPVALGFGISTPQHARDAARVADAVVVGSAIVKRIHQAPHNAKGRAAVAKWVGSLVKAVKEV